MRFNDKMPTTTIILNAGQDAIITENPPVQPPVETAKLRSPQPNKEVQYSQFSRIENYPNPRLITGDEDWAVNSKAAHPLTRIERNERTTDSQKALMSLLEMFLKISPHIVDLIKAFKTGNPKALSPLLDIDGVKELLPHVLPLLNQTKHPLETEDLEQSARDVWAKIAELGSPSFRKVELTKALQSKYRARQIQKALDQLEAKGLISHIPESKTDGPGAKRSPLYRVNETKGDGLVSV